MWYKMSKLGVATMAFQHGTTPRFRGADDPPDGALGDLMAHTNQICLQLLKNRGLQGLCVCPGAGRSSEVERSLMV